MRKFNERSGEADNTVVLCISADLPFAQSRFCGAENVNNVVTLSTLRGAEFIENYGVAIADGPLKGLTARASISLPVPVSPTISIGASCIASLRAWSIT